MQVDTKFTAKQPEISNFHPKKASRLFREKVEQMKLARQAASSQMMSAVEFVRQSPKEVRAQPLPRGEKSGISS